MLEQKEKSCGKINGCDWFVSLQVTAGHGVLLHWPIGHHVLVCKQVHDRSFCLGKKSSFRWFRY